MTHDFRPRPPSSFHNDRWQAVRAGSKHDAMQAELLVFLRSRPVVAIPDGAIVHRHVEGEYPLTRNGQIIAYTDAIDITTINLMRIVSLFEVKPKIETVFGIVRQAKALLSLAGQCISGDHYHCHIVVPHDDPALPDLRGEWPNTWAWGAFAG